MSRPGTVVAVLGLGAIGAATLWPFAFDPRALTWAEYVGAFALAPRSMLDFPRNIVLFMPFGAGLAMLLVDSRDRAWWTRVLLSGVAGLVASICVETLQVFLPGRTPSVSDIIGNAVGGAAGAFAYHRWRHREVLPPVPPGRRRSMPQVSAVALGLYLLLMLLVVWGLMWGVRPQGWDAAYRLALSSEFAYDKPWQGTVSELLVLDRAVDDADAQRLLAGEIPPALAAAVVATRETTAGPLADRINRSGQFTLAVTVATHDLTQEDPAPIVTSSADLSVGNLSLGQDEAHLVLRWRSPLTLANHMEPQLEFPGVFRSVEPQRLVISFDGALGRVRTAQGDTAILLGPEAVFSAMLRETNCWPVRPDRFEWWASAVPLSAVMFSPLGALLGPAVRLARRRRSRVALILGGLCVPALVVEGFVAVYRSGGLRLDILVLGIALTSVGLVVRQLCPAWPSERPLAGPVSADDLCVVTRGG